MTDNETKLTIETLEQTIETLTKRNILLEAKAKLWQHTPPPLDAGLIQLSLIEVVDIFMEQSEMITRLLDKALDAAKQKPLSVLQKTVTNRLVFEAAIQACCWVIFAREHGTDVTEALRGMDPEKLNNFLKANTTGVELDKMDPVIPAHSKS